MIPTVSVIICVYNRFELTKRAVESVLNQTLPVHEVLLVDDGSFDGTSELLPPYIASNPAWRERVRYSRQENQGPGAARNSGISQANGQWLAFLDNDDLWLPQKLEWQFRALDQFKNECGACITDAWFMNNPQMKMTLFQLTGKRHSDSLGIIRDPQTYILKRTSSIGGHPVWLQTLILQADLARRLGGFDPKLRCGEDDEFVFRLACETKLCYANIPLVLIDRTPPSKRHVGVDRDWDAVEFRLRMAQYRYEKRLAMCDRLTQRVRHMIQADLAAVHSGWANWFLQKKDYQNAQTALTKAARARLRPSIAVKWALMRCAPRVTRKLVLMREGYRSRRHSGIG
jgi:glycosyltransferase involved in cell wall biosynthesis